MMFSVRVRVAPFFLCVVYHSNKYESARHVGPYRFSKEKESMIEKLITASNKVGEARDILGDKFMFAQVVFYTDKNEEVGDVAFSKLKELGFEPDGFNSWCYTGRSK